MALVIILITDVIRSNIININVLVLMDKAVTQQGFPKLMGNECHYLNRSNISSLFYPSSNRREVCQIPGVFGFSFTVDFNPS